MNESRTRYPDYNVLSQSEEWDPHTQSIVLQRMGPFPKLDYLTPIEAKVLKIIAKHLAFDERDDILNFIIYHIDQSLSSDIGESERKPDAPKLKDLVRWGLSAINNLAHKMFQKDFSKIGFSAQFNIISSLQTGNAESVPDWNRAPQKELFKKLTGMVIGAYYSHPTIWSEIGYGGPAYPRGYVRIEHQLVDPWEAKCRG